MYRYRSCILPSFGEAGSLAYNLRRSTLSAARWLLLWQNGRELASAKTEDEKYKYLRDPSEKDAILTIFVFAHDLTNIRIGGYCLLLLLPAAD